MSLNPKNQQLAADFNNLKARVKTEMTRRSGQNSLTSYAGSQYDYTRTPAKGVQLQTEHINKIIIPMNAIAPSGYNQFDAGDQAVSVADLTTRISAHESRSTKEGAATDCVGGCNGLCSTGCFAGCSGCTGTCNTTCKGECTGSCTGTCKLGCTQSCSDDCYGGCSESCEGFCGDYCESVCGETCTVGCSGGCRGGCTGDGCEGSCKGDCLGSCNDTCRSGCRGTAK